MLLRFSLVHASAIGALWLVGCGCGDDQRYVEEPVVPPVIRTYTSEAPESGLYAIDAGDGTNARFYEVGTEADWLNMPCTEACARAVGGLLPEEIKKCRAPERASDGKLHLRCEWIRKGNCNEGRL